MRFPFLLGLLTALSAATAVANDGAFFGHGSAVWPLSEQRVRMVSEDIVIRHAPVQSIDRYESQATAWLAECRFVFENLESEPVEVLMGFPDSFQSELSDSDIPLERHAFTTWVRGEPVMALHAGVEPPPGHEAGGFDPSYTAAWTWSVRFDPGERIEVRNSYRFGSTTSNGPIDGCLGEADADAGVRAEAWWASAPPGPCGDLPGDGLCKSLHYVVLTARTWSGPIERADIAIELPPGSLAHEILALPAATRIADGFVRWRFEDWTPDRDIALVVAPFVPFLDAPGCEAREGLPRVSFRNAEQARAWVTWARRNGVGRDMARLVRNAVFASHGHRPRDPQVLRTLDRTSWWPRVTAKPVPLDDEAWRIVAILREFEDSIPRRR